ncbi:unnamed protein product [Ectocarpus fasciculatus]
MVSLGDIDEVGLPGLFAFEDCDFDENGEFESVKPAGGGVRHISDVVPMDDEEKELVRDRRKETHRAEIAIQKERAKEAEGCVKSDGGKNEDVRSGGGKKGGGGVRAERLEYRKRAFAKINQLVLSASKDRLKSFAKGTSPKRATLEYSLKNDQKTIRVAFHDNVKRFLYLVNPGEKEFLDEFYLKLNDGKSRPGSKADDFRKEHRIEWSYHDWSSGDVCVSVLPEEESGKKRALVRNGAGKSEKKRKAS